MKAAAVCPDDPILQNLLLGKLPSEQVDPWSEHVLRCSRCAERSATLRLDDTMSDALAHAKEDTSCDRDPLAQDLMKKLQRLIPQLAQESPTVASNAAPLKTSGSASESSPSAAEDAPAATSRTEGIPQGFEDVVSFLAPALAPHELGRLGPYRVRAVLGAGGMGVVFKAEDPHLDRTVALKVMKPSLGANPAAKQRFLREAKAAALLKSDYIVTIHQVSEDRGVPFLAMEFLEGFSLGDRLKAGNSLSLQQTVRMAIQVAKGLAAAHHKGLIHRDIKPDNIWIEPSALEGAEPEAIGRAKILDFGLARAAAGGEQQLTQAGSILGTPAFMALEQARGDQVDHRCDLFSLGAVLYRVLTGELPFQGSDTIATLMSLAMKDPVPPHQLNAQVPLELSRFVMRLLEKDADKRPQTAKEVAAELQRIERGLEAAAGTSTDMAVMPSTPVGAETSGVGTGIPARQARPTPSWLVFIGIALAVLLPLSWFFGATAFRFVTNKGELIVEVHDPNIEVLIRKDGLVVQDKTSKREFTLGAGTGELEVLEKDGLKLLTRKFELSRGGKTTVTVTLKELADARKKPPDSGPAFAMPSGLANLDPKLIPAAERFPWQPKELVAVLGEHRGRHWGPLRRVDWSPDDRFIATSGFGVTELWDPRTLRSLAFIPNSQSVLAFAPDGKTVAVSSVDGVSLWDVTGAEPKEKTFIPIGEGHYVSSLAFAPGDTTLGCGYSDKTVRLWDVRAEKPREQAVLKGHTGIVRGVAFSPDGKTLASGSEDKTFRLWDLTAAEPKESAVLPAQGEVRGLAFSSDGKTLATGGFDRLRLWDLTGAKPKETAVVGGPQGTFCLAFTPDSKTLACSNLPSGPPGLLDVTGLKPRVKAVVKGMPNGASALSPDGKTFVSTDGVALRLWDLAGDEPQERLEPQGHRGPLGGAVLAPDGKTLATYAQSDRVVRLWDLSGTAPRQRAELRHENYVFGVAFSPDGKTLVSGDNPGTVRLWDLTGAEPEERIRFKPGAACHAFAFALDGKTLACSNYQTNTIHLWDVSGEEPKQRAVLPDSRRSCAFAPDGKTLACYRRPEKEDHYVLLWDLSGGEPKERGLLKPTLENVGVGDWPGPLTWASDGKTLAVPMVANTTPRGLLWDVSRAKPRERDLLEAGLSPLAFAPDGKTLACSVQSGGIALWDVAKAKQLRTWRLPGSVNGATFTQDGRHLITANSNGTAYVLRLDPPPETKAVFSLDGLDPEKIPASERFPWQPKELVAVVGEHRGRHWGTVRQAVWSADGKFIATAGQDGTILWDPQTLRQRHRLPGSAGDVAVAPDGKALAIATLDGTIRLWDMSGGEPKERAVIRPQDGVLCLAFAPDGTTLACGCRTKTVRLWDVTAEMPKERAVLNAHTEWVRAVAFAPDGKTLAVSGGVDDQKPAEVHLWDLSAAEPKEKAVVKVKPLPVRLVFSPDDKTLAGALGTGGATRLWDVTGAEPTQKADFWGGGYGTVAFSPDGKTLARSAEVHASATFLVDLIGVEPRERARLKSAGGALVAFAPDGKKLLTASHLLGVLRLWDLTGDEPRELLEPQVHTGPLGGAILAPDGNTLATFSDGDKVIRLWELSGTAPRQRAELRGHTSFVKGVAFAPDSKTLVSCSHDSTVRLWDPTKTEPEERVKFKPDGGQVLVVQFTPDGKTLACECASGIHLWDVSGEEPKQRAVLKDCGRPLTITADGKTLIAFGVKKDRTGDGTLRLWDLTAAEPRERDVLVSESGGSGPAPAVSPDGKLLAFPVSRGTRVKMWTLDGTKPRSLDDITTEGPVTSVAFAADSKTLAIGETGGVSLWDVKKRKQQGRWNLPGAVNGVAFSPDGRHLITANANGTAYILRLPTEASTSAGPERNAAAWVLSLGGKVSVKAAGTH